MTNTSNLKTNNFVELNNFSNAHPTPQPKSKPIYKSKLKFNVMSIFTIMCKSQKEKRVYERLISITEKKLELGKVLRMNFQMELIKRYLLPENCRGSFDMKIPLDVMDKECENKTEMIQVFDNFIKNEEMGGIYETNMIEKAMESILKNK